MSFKTDIYPHRTNRAEFLRRLLQKVDREWLRLTTVGHSYVLPGGVSRGNMAPQYLDKQRIKALLKAWLRQLPPANDRYLDVQALRHAEYQRFASVDAAFQAIRKNASEGGAVKFILNELESSGTGQSGSTVFFGARLFDNWSYDTYFSYLLDWDDNHCYGLMRELALQEARYGLGGGGSLHPVWRAARQWLIANRDKGVYKMYNLRFE